MSIIQKIRDKAAVIGFGAIALSLIAFILQDSFMGKGRGGVLSSLKDKIGSVNGSGIEYKAFNDKVSFYEEMQKRNNQPVTDEARQQLYDGVWEEFVGTKVLTPVYEKLGIKVTTKEVNDQLYGQQPPSFMQQLFADPNTGQYNSAGARDFIKNMKKRKDIDPFYVKYIENGIDQQVINGGMQRKYIALLSGAAYYPKWLADKENADNNAAANISYVNIPYSTISDSTIKVSDDEITAYIQKHKDEYKQEKSAELSYVVFSAAPTSADSQKLFSDVLALKPKFAADTNTEAFFSLNNSAQQYYNGFVAKSKIQVPNKDSIFALPKNGVFGPYLDVDHYVVAKMIDVKSMPDSVICRHILLSAQKTPDSIGKKRIDSIAEAINNGASFVKLMKQYSDDEASKTQDSLGKMRFSADLIQNAQSFDQDFAQFILYNGTAGQRKVVKTKFGWHLIEILEQKNFEPFYKIAYFSQKIDPSNETVSKANSEATSFAAESVNAKAFEENAKKKNLILTPVSIKEKDYTLPGLGYGRKMVKWAFENDKGKISDPETFGNNYIVALITDKKEEGTQDAKTARPLVEGFVRNQKKAQQIIKQIGNSNDLNAIASANKVALQRADSISFQAAFIPNVGAESKLVGAAFAKQNLNKVSAPIAGTTGVFVIKVEQLFTKPNPAIDYKTQRQQMEGGMKNTFAYRSIDALKKAATIKDKRIKFF
ncbi:MAG: peptidylprolyl isomerase [Sphingobacteriales bacterium]